jgi:hypothetical protein
VTVRFELRDTERTPRRYWLVVRGPDPEVCVKPPGFAEDVVVTTDPGWLARWALGDTSLGRGMRAGRVEAEGPRHLVRTLGGWVDQGLRSLETWGREPAVAGR